MLLVYAVCFISENVNRFHGHFAAGTFYRKQFKRPLTSTVASDGGRSSGGDVTGQPP